MRRTQDELFAWAARVRREAMEISEHARAACARAQEIRDRHLALERVYATTAPTAVDDTPVDDLPLEEAAERALLRQFTAEEIAGYVGVPVDYVMRAAHERAALKRRPVDDTLRAWFRVLIA